MTYGELEKRNKKKDKKKERKKHPYKRFGPKRCMDIKDKD